jgi:hypothetical protein
MMVPPLALSCKLSKKSKSQEDSEQYALSEETWRSKRGKLGSRSLLNHRSLNFKDANYMKRHNYQYCDLHTDADNY